MAKKPTSNVDEEAKQDSAPSNPSAKTDQPETETSEEPLNLAEVMQGMNDFELVQVGLCVMALLHKRATEDEPDES